MSRLLLTGVSLLVIFITDCQCRSVIVPKKKQEPPRGPMIHVRLDEKTHRELKIYAVSSGGTIQSVVSDLIRKKMTETKSHERPSNGKGGSA